MVGGSWCFFFFSGGGWWCGFAGLRRKRLGLLVGLFQRERERERDGDGDEERGRIKKEYF